MRSMRSMRGGLFPVVEGPCKRYAMTRHVCQATTASRGRRRSVPQRETARTKRRGSTVTVTVTGYLFFWFHGWMAVQVEPTQSLTH
jgi:hypothetical protein